MLISLLAATFVLFNVFNVFFLHSPLVGLSSGLFLIFIFSFITGGYFFKNKSRKEQVFFGFLSFLSVTIIFLTIFYYFYQLNNLIIVLFLTLYFLITLFFNWKLKVGDVDLGLKDGIKKILFNFKFFLSKNLWFVVYLFLLVGSYLILRQGATLEAIRTPWFSVPKIFFGFYFLASFLLVYLNFKLKNIYSFIANILHLFFSFSVANIIFPLGFGYDPFIHQATEKYILEHGFILPKNFYYLGQYSLVVFLSKFLGLSHEVIDKNLVATLASLLLPVSIYYAFRKFNFSAIVSRLLILFFFLLPFAALNFTTPQNLADLLLLIIIFLGLAFLNSADCNLSDYFLLFLLALSVLLIHPIAGVAVSIFLSFLFFKKLSSRQKIKNKKIFFALQCFLVTISSAVYLLVFFIFSKVSGLYKINLINNFNLNSFYHNIFRFIPDLYLNTNFIHLFKTLIYFLWQPLILFILIFVSSIYGYYIFKKHHPLLSNYLLIFLILFFNSFFIFSIIEFPFLINYERGDFSWRIFNLAVYFLWPLSLLVIGHFLEKIDFKIKKYFLGLFFLLAGCLTISLYFSYPRQDVYMFNRGFNTSIHDFRAVKYLEEKTPEPYVVLANQQIGAAALKEFGFRYFDQKYFFYSIPTGGNLYQIYAKMAYEEKISYAVAKEAMDLVGVNVVYLYLPDYWFNLKKIMPQLEAVAQETIKLENEKIFIFKFVRQNNK